MRALFLTTYPKTAAATRFRLLQFFPYLEREGIECILSPFLSERDFSQLYVRKRFVRKALRLLAKGAWRIAESARARQFDVVMVQRNTMLYGPPLMEWLIVHAIRKPLVYDFDDAIWLPDESLTWGKWASWAKFTGKTSQLVRMASHVVVCNEYTRDYALRYRKPEHVTVIPTVVDPSVFHPVEHSAKRRPVVGWIGTHSTARYLDSMLPALEVAGRVAPFRLKVVGAGRDFHLPGVEVENKPWRLGDEVADYQSLDIGLYPVADDAWGQGKTGFKPIVYMSCGAPCIASPVGGVTEFIEDGVSGLFARTHDEWALAVTRLVSDFEFRRRLGDAARQIVLDRYSLQAQAPRLARVLKAAARA